MPQDELTASRVRIGISIVSHGHVELVKDLLRSFDECADIGDFDVVVVVTENTGMHWHSDAPKCHNFDSLWRYNLAPRGFGSNHNAAFEGLDCDLFFVVNPDVLLAPGFSIRSLITTVPQVGILSATIINTNGRVADFLREDLTLISLFRRFFGVRKNLSSDSFDWFSGVFMVFDSNTYREVCGFDERFFMYVEDCDLCMRLKRAGGELVVSGERVIHAEGRRTLKSWRHFRWHIVSIVRYIFFIKFFR